MPSRPHIRPRSCCLLGPNNPCHDTQQINCCTILGATYANELGYSCEALQPIQPLPPVVTGCTDPAATNYNPSATADDGSCVYPAPLIAGCTDPAATNYDPSATTDNGSCVYPAPLIAGCTDPAATNYNPSAASDNGSCVYPAPLIAGCTDPAATNYNPSAATDNGSCVYKPEPVTQDQVLNDILGQKTCTCKI